MPREKEEALTHRDRHQVHCLSSVLAGVWHVEAWPCPLLRGTSQRQCDLTPKVLIRGHRGALNKGLSIRLWQEALTANLSCQLTEN